MALPARSIAFTVTKYRTLSLSDNALVLASVAVPTLVKAIASVPPDVVPMAHSYRSIPLPPTSAYPDQLALKDVGDFW